MTSPIDHLDRPGRPPARATRRPSQLFRAAALATTALVLLPACTDALRAGGSDDDPDPDPKESVALAAWPDAEGDADTVRTTSPVFGDVEVAARPLLREPDGTATLLLDIDNRSSSTISLTDFVGNADLGSVSIREADGRTRHLPLRTDNNACVCSTDTVLPAGTVTTLHATFAEVEDEADAYRVDIPGWRPIDQVPVRDIEGFEVSTTAETALEAEPERSLDVRGVWRTDDGLLVRLDETNTSPDSVSSFDLTSPRDVAVVDLEGRRRAAVRIADSGGQPVASDSADSSLASGDTFTRDILLADLPGADEVVVTIAGARRTLPVTVGSTPPSTELEYGALRGASTASLDTRRVLERTTPLALAEPDVPALDEEGPRLTYGPVVDTLTSEAQPGWSVSPRSVIRVGNKSLLTLDLSRNGADRSWPQGLGDSSRSALDAIALLDVDNELRVGALGSSARGPLGSREGRGVADGFTRSLYIAYPALDAGVDAVSVDVPGFGRVDGVPVVDAPDPAPADAAVKASTVMIFNDGLRLDLLDVAPLADDEGTLVRFRAVNESHPSAVEAPFVSDGGCDLALVDADSDRRFVALDPCVATVWAPELDAGQGIEFEVRFPRLPADVERVIVDGGDITGTPPVVVGEQTEPWYLDLPRRADATEGDVQRASIGIADDLQTEIRDGDEIDLQLDADVLFEFGSAELTPEARARVEAIGERLAGQNTGAISVTGHTDSVGDPDANLILSEERAQAVADVLDEVAGNRFDLTVDGRGDRDPVADNEIDGRDNPDGRARNRRVTITYRAG